MSSERIVCSCPISAEVVDSMLFDRRQRKGSRKLCVVATNWLHKTVDRRRSSFWDAFRDAEIQYIVCDVLVQCSESG